MLEMNPQNRITFDDNLSWTEIFITSKFGRENPRTKCHVKQQKLKLEEVILRSFKSTSVLGEAVELTSATTILVCPNFLPIFCRWWKILFENFLLSRLWRTTILATEHKNSGPIVGPLSIQTYSKSNKSWHFLHSSFKNKFPNHSFLCHTAAGSIV